VASAAGSDLTAGAKDYKNGIKGRSEKRRWIEIMKPLTALSIISLILCGCGAREPDSFKVASPVSMATKEGEITVIVSSQTDFQKAIEASTVADLFTKFHVSAQLSV
jgi:hypothetical protein